VGEEKKKNYYRGRRRVDLSSPFSCGGKKEKTRFSLSSLVPEGKGKKGHGGKEGKASHSTALPRRRRGGKSSNISSAKREPYSVERKEGKSYQISHITRKLMKRRRRGKTIPSFCTHPEKQEKKGTSKKGGKRVATF